MNKIKYSINNSIKLIYFFYNIIIVIKEEDYGKFY
jgi:hypothetical protein